MKWNKFEFFIWMDIFTFFFGFFSFLIIKDFFSSIYTK
jgi:hypothetical protein